MTTTMAINKRVSYIANLKLRDDNRMDEFKIAKKKSVQKDIADVEALTVGGGLVSFVSGISSQHKEDVLNSTLLAQLAANAKFNKEEEPRKWYGKYNEVLNNVGWNYPAFNFKKDEVSGASFTLDKKVLQALTAIADPKEIINVERMMDSLNEDPKNENAVELFDTVGMVGRQGVFQVFPCADDDGNVVMLSSCMQFSASEHVTRFLWFKWKSKTVELWQSAQKCVLSENVYAQVRKDIVTKLGDRATKYVINIELGDF
jgi:hypothetical protein